MTTAISKGEAHRLVDALPPDATWDVFLRKMYVRAVIERGMAESQAGRGMEVAVVRAQFESQEGPEGTHE